MKKLLVLAAAIVLLGMPGCREKGTAQKAGERVDEIVDNVQKGDPPLKEKGPLEKMGDSIDDSVRQTDKK